MRRTGPVSPLRARIGERKRSYDEPEEVEP
jgi:hypothetical protein